VASLNESNLVFLISQPRSGSTLLQKLLSQNSLIHTQSEPWLMLHPAYSLKGTGVYAEYNKELEKKAFSGFIDNLPNGGRKVYIQKIRDMYLSLYDEYLKGTEHYFLDKTPRYYFIWKELQEIYPNAKYIILRRNPISVLYSIIMTWNTEKWFRLYEYKHDLKTAISSLIEMTKHEVGHHVKYEEIVENPLSELRKLSTYIGIPFRKRMLSYNNNEKWEYGDKDYISSQTKISSDRMNLWEKSDVSQQTWRALSDYLEWIGNDRLAQLGYDYGVIRNILDKNMPATSVYVLENNTFSLELLLDGPNNLLFENSQLREKIAAQEKEIVFIKQIKSHLDKHIQMDLLRQPVAKMRTYRYLLKSYKSFIESGHS
jgi:hypothetical protein